MVRRADRNLYRQPKSRHWWVRLNIEGRKVRRSTGTADLVVAMAFRDRMLAQRAIEQKDADWNAWVDEQLKSPTSWLRLTYARMKRKTRKRKWAPCLSLAELAQLVKQSSGRCSITGIELSRPNGTAAPFNASIDRRDSSAGYVFGNCRVVCLAVNVAMREWGEDAIRQIARSLVEHESGILEAVKK